MEILVCIFSIWVLIKNLSYAVYEYKVNNNTAGSIMVVLLNIICFILINTMLILS